MIRYTGRTGANTAVYSQLDFDDVQEAEVTFQSHNWPHWGNEVINNQALTYINQGYPSDELSLHTGNESDRAALERDTKARFP